MAPDGWAQILLFPAPCKSGLTHPPSPRHTLMLQISLETWVVAPVGIPSYTSRDRTKQHVQCGTNVNYCLQVPKIRRDAQVQGQLPAWQMEAILMLNIVPLNLDWGFSRIILAFGHVKRILFSLFKTRKDFHLNPNSGSVSCVPWLACTTLFTKICPLIKSCFLGMQNSL